MIWFRRNVMISSMSVAGDVIENSEALISRLVEINEKGEYQGFNINETTPSEIRAGADDDTSFEIIDLICILLSHYFKYVGGIKANNDRTVFG